MSSETAVAVLWLVITTVGLLASVRAMFRGFRRFRESGKDPVGRVINAGLLGVGIVGSVSFGFDLSAAITALVLPATELPATDYEIRRAVILRLELIAGQTFNVCMVLIPEVVDRALVRLAGKHDHGNISDIGGD